jgi:hypothetical protein
VARPPPPTRGVTKCSMWSGQRSLDPTRLGVKSSSSVVEVRHVLHHLPGITATSEGHTGMPNLAARARRIEMFFGFTPPTTGVHLQHRGRPRLQHLLQKMAAPERTCSPVATGIGAQASVRRSRRGRKVHRQAGWLLYPGEIELNGLTNARPLTDRRPTAWFASTAIRMSAPTVLPRAKSQAALVASRGSAPTAQGAVAAGSRPPLAGEIAQTSGRCSPATRAGRVRGVATLANHELGDAPPGPRSRGTGCPSRLFAGEGSVASPG